MPTELWIPLVWLVIGLLTGAVAGIHFAVGWYLRDATTNGILIHNGVSYRVQRIGRKPKP